MSAIVTEIARDAGLRKTIDGFVPIRIWQVKLDSAVSGAQAAIEAVTADPTLGSDIGDAHPLDPFVFLSELSAESAGSRTVWRVTGTYREDILIQSAATPLEEPTQVSWGSNTYIEPVVNTIFGTSVTNSAGQPFDPPLTQERVTLIATITYNSESFDPDLPMEYQGKINQSATPIGTITVPARMARIIEISGIANIFEDISYFNVTIKVEINPKITKDSQGNTIAQGWDREVLDQGIFGLDDDDNLVRLATDDGEEVTEPLKLNGAGKKLDPQTLDPVFLIYFTYELADFGPLNLETPVEVA